MATTRWPMTAPSTLPGSRSWRIPASINRTRSSPYRRPISPSLPTFLPRCFAGDILPVLLLLCHLASIFLFLLGSWRVAQRIFSTRRSCWGAVLLAACCFTLPVAGTSLSIMDPYVTARSFSTPLSLFALAAVLDENWGQAILWLALTALLHPLMAGYAAIAMLTLALARRKMWRSLGLFAALGWLLCAVIFMVTRHADPSLAYNQAALSRSYFFLSSWRWYEYPGLLIPLLLLGIAGAHSRAPWPARALAIAATIVGGCALLTSLCFVHRSGSLLLARLQVLRAFQFVYLAGVLLAGGMLAKLARSVPSACYVYLLLGAMFAGQRLTYPESQPCGMAWANATQSLAAGLPLDSRQHAQDAVFALDNDYIESAGEDAQGFRATAERSAVADWFQRRRHRQQLSSGGRSLVARRRRPPRSSTAPPMSSAWPGFGPSASPGSFCRPRRTPAFPVRSPTRASASAG